MGETQSFDHPERVAARQAYFAEAQRRRAAQVDDRTALAREIARSQQQAGAGADVVRVPTNFITDPSQRLSFTTPAGQSAYRADTPRAVIDPNQARLAAAEAAREAGAHSQLAGSHIKTESPTSWDAREVIRIPATYRRSSGQVDWSRVSEDGD
jgi:hypothetical protein